MSEDSAPEFVDTNVLIYAHDRSAGTKHERARALLEELWNSGNGCVSIQVLQEFYVNVTRKVAIPLAPEAAAQIIADLSVWSVHRPTVDDVLLAVQLQQRFQISFWDSMVIVSAQQLGCHTLWSEDLSSGQSYGQLTVMNPFV